MIRKLAVMMLVAAAAVPAAAGTIAQWNFNSQPSDSSATTGTTVASTGTGSISLVGGTTATFASGDANGGSTDPITGTPTNDSGWNISTFAAATAGNKTRGIQIQVSTLGLKDIALSWDQRHSNTSARHVQVQYSTDGSSFTDFGAAFVGTAGDTWFNNRSVDFSTVSALNNVASVYFRIVAAFAPGGSSYVASANGSTYGSAGTWRFDMVTVSGTAIPPVTVVPLPSAILAGAALMGMLPVASRLVRRK